jgi:YHS domain-containing protein
MTSARRQRKSGMAPAAGKPARVAPAAALFLVLFLTLGGLSRVEAATTERVVADVVSGLAISGVDPVSYFTHQEPIYGNAENEYRYGGVTWRFRNSGDQAAFAANPEVYMPRYGGHDPVALGRGVAVAGNPLLWAMIGQRVYLFYDEKSRARFLDNPADAIATADDKWPTVMKTLVQ